MFLLGIGGIEAWHSAGPWYEAVLLVAVKVQVSTG